MRSQANDGAGKIERVQGLIDTLGEVDTPKRGEFNISDRRARRV